MPYQDKRFAKPPGACTQSSTFSRFGPNTDYSSSERVFVLCKPAGELTGSETAIFGLDHWITTHRECKAPAGIQASGPFCRYPAY